jgi:acyl transferase domain-containing protein
MSAKKAMLVCPGRGTYNKEELGYLKRHHADRAELIAGFDRYRQEKGQTEISELDGLNSFSLAEHSRGDNASPLIYSCAYCDFLSIDPKRFELVAVTGNSMGWYIALACAGALNNADALHLINTMGTLMQERLIGGQVLYPFVDDEWRPIPGRKEELLALCTEIPSLYLSIDLGGMIVFGGSEEALTTLETRLTPVDRFPMRLQNHAAFHTILQEPVASEAKQMLPPSLFNAPDVPLIDGRGHIFSPSSSSPDQIWEYTLGHQVTKAYNFTRAVQVGLKEFAPECIIILGPGTTLGGATAQSVIEMDYGPFDSKSEFIRLQSETPFILSMGHPQQRKDVIAS